MTNSSAAAAAAGANTDAPAREAARPVVAASSSSSAAASSSSSSGTSSHLHFPQLHLHPSAGAYSHALPPPPADAALADQAANPLGILALFESATTGIGPKLAAGGISCMVISAVLNPMDVIKVRTKADTRKIDSDRRMHW